MIQVIVKRQREHITGFRVEGHSGYADRGSDIICSAVSALTINCVNSIEELAGDEIRVESDEESGMIDLTVRGIPSEEASLFLKSWQMGILEISRTYGKQYVSVKS